MSNPRLVCPMCDAVLQLRSALKPGAHTRCPQCGTPFSLDTPATSPPPAEEMAAPHPESAQPATRQAPAHRPVPPADRDDDRPAHPLRDGDQPAAGMSPLLIAAVAAGGGAALA